MYVLVVAISGGDVVATSVVAKSAPSTGSQADFPASCFVSHIPTEVGRNISLCS